MDQKLKIGELARLSGTTTKTIRYYELLGLLHEPDRTESGYRLYEEKDVERLTFIRKAKSLGFSLNDVKETLTIYDSQQTPCVHVLGLLDQKIGEIAQLIEELQQLQRELALLREESGPMVEICGEGDSICTILDREIYGKGQAALTWLEGRQMGKTDF